MSLSPTRCRCSLGPPVASSLASAIVESALPRLLPAARDIAFSCPPPACDDVRTPELGCERMLASSAIPYDRSLLLSTRLAHVPTPTFLAPLP